MIKQLDSYIFYFDFVENSFEYILANVFVPKEIRKGRKEGIFEGKKNQFLKWGKQGGLGYELKVKYTFLTAVEAS
jgi:hypothetical protein